MVVVTPQFSVVVLAYNNRSYIQQARVSPERQAFQDFEVLVVDDGSTDGKAEVVKPFKERDSRFQFLHKHNGGLSSAHNYDISAMPVPKYIAI